ncbi:MAG: Asp-tRNA(Asn)/Glu-tRNA(Gln) amidotransferase subunit GatA [Oscillospiraceae bacterium]|jgi:aspartyl-tRNA(Asn)/glutamyl-tRNA(Gln) amidotransferase subunit A|nr:Asp-tRNA(Asn)/Glu-tRNA(Gln) amidotransferase subunit GatA [Oscillospiraceae bacterium]
MFDLSATELSAAIKAKKISVAEAVESYMGRIEKTDKSLNAFITVSKEKALARAAEVQGRIDGGETLSPLAGVPIAIKDNISVKDIETTCASKTLEGYTPVFSATAVERLERAGAVIVGKLNMDEFAMGGSSETGVYGAVRNPWDNARVAGGSSGGSAAAVAGGEIPLALGSDTGGSIRQPCSFCGATGIKPTYGSVSRYGLIAYASSLDQIGPIGRGIGDCAALLSIISGTDEKDSTCVIKEPFDFGGGFPDNANGLKIGIPRNYFGDGVDESVKKSVLAAAEELEEAGATVGDFEMPLMDYMIPAYYIIACAEASSNLSRYDGLKYGYRSAKAKTLPEVYRLSRSEGFGIEVKRRIMLGSFVLSSGYYDAYYKKALQARYLIKEAYDGLFKRFDAILSPTAPTTAYKIGENVGDPMKMYMGDIYTVSVNLAGLPAVALPCGFDERGLPVGFQLVGNAFSDGILVKAARVYQNRTDFHARKPKTGGEAQ